MGGTHMTIAEYKVVSARLNNYIYIYISDDPCSIQISTELPSALRFELGLRVTCGNSEVLSVSCSKTQRQL